MKTKLLILSSLIAVAACSEEHGDLQTWMQETRNAAKSKVRPVEPPKPLERVEYFAPQLEGPHAFSPNKMRSAAQATNAPDMNRPKELLENYSLENIKFVGFIGENNGLSALIEVGDKEANHSGKHIYTVRPGNYLGQNYGKISKITSDGIELVEVTEDTQGNWINRTMLITVDGPTEINSSK